MPNAPRSELLNLGPVSLGWLREGGIHTRADLARLGAVVAYRMLKMQQPGASLNLLNALQAALDGVSRKDLPADTKQRLRDEAEA